MVAPNGFQARMTAATSRSEEIACEIAAVLRKLECWVDTAGRGMRGETSSIESDAEASCG